MRFRLTTLLAASFAAAVVLGMNFWERNDFPVYHARVDDSNTLQPIESTYGWPSVVQEVSFPESGRRVYWRTWAIASNGMVCLLASLAVGALTEWIARRRPMTT